MNDVFTGGDGDGWALVVVCAIANKPRELAVEPRFTIRDDCKTETRVAWYAPASHVRTHAKV